MKIAMYEVNENTCNAVIDHLMSREEDISNEISNIIMSGKDSTEAELNYQYYCDIMDSVLEFRRNHSCAIKGDANYSTNIFAR